MVGIYKSKFLLCTYVLLKYKLQNLSVKLSVNLQKTTNLTDRCHLYEHLNKYLTQVIHLHKSPASCWKCIRLDTLQFDWLIFVLQNSTQNTAFDCHCGQNFLVVDIYICTHSPKHDILSCQGNEKQRSWVELSGNGSKTGHSDHTLMVLVWY